MLKKYLIANLLLFLISVNVNAEELPTKLQVALMQKIIAMEQNLASKKTISIYILDAPHIFNLLSPEVGFKYGNAILQTVEQGTTIPNKKYDVIYIGSIADEEQAVNYATKYSSLSLYPMLTGMNNLGSLGLGIRSGRPIFLLNLSQSSAENLQWLPAILRLSIQI